MAPSAPWWRAPWWMALRAEWTKARTLPAAPWLLAATAALTVAVGVAADGALGCTGGSCAALAGTDPAKVALTGVQAGQALAVIVGALAIGGEYGGGMIRVTLTAVPRRLAVFAAKAAVVTGALLTAGAVAALASVLAGRQILGGRAFAGPPLSLADGSVLRAAGGSVLYLALVGLLAFGVATAVRDTTVAIGTTLAALLVFPVLSHVVTDPVWSRHLQQASPMTAGEYILDTVGVRSLPLTPWQGLGVLGLWALAALLAGGLVFRLRDA